MKVKLFLLLGILFTYLVMVWGGLVRTTDSGLACPSWPLCYGDFSIPKDLSAKLEMGHRTISGLAGVFVLLSFIYVWRQYKGLPKLTSAIALFFTLSAAFTGMRMIKEETPHLKHLSHMFIESFHIYESMLVLFGLVLTYRFLYSQRWTRGSIPLWAYAFAIATMLTGVLVRYTGSGEACGHEWPTCNGYLIPPMEDWRVALQFIHRNLAYTTWLAFLIVFLADRNRITLITFLLINLQFVFAISMVLSGFFTPLVFLDTASGFFLFVWLTYHVNLSLGSKREVRLAW
ncbi:COX15/CtaA family protein [Thermocrinis minervae]|uniref:Cytochrome c oxidase assembly protein subunit 15 n=1 Tax=Thermocrinis minervae TaxID=381751 RepID=A0A1M6S3D5_9AQUI|nr:COX15/CtaA family protein [Thermocrinis minervae]SHK38987.1 cytochrome c oxidase assembly protein subunit 15 [Thermocrinis minervae]